MGISGWGTNYMIWETGTYWLKNCPWDRQKTTRLAAQNTKCRMHVFWAIKRMYLKRVGKMFVWVWRFSGACPLQILNARYGHAMRDICLNLFGSDYFYAIKPFWPIIFNPKFLKTNFLLKKETDQYQCNCLPEMSGNLMKFSWLYRHFYEISAKLDLFVALLWLKCNLFWGT